jgi:iron(III) transport system permease protein
MLFKAQLDNYRYLNTFRPFWDAMKNSIILALLTASVAMLLTSLIAWIVYRSRLPGAWLLDFLAFVPITIPGIVMGMALILLYVAFPIPIYGTIWVLLIAYVTRFIPYGMRSASVQSYRFIANSKKPRPLPGFVVGDLQAGDLAAVTAGDRGGMDLYLYCVFREFSTPSCLRPVKVECFQSCSSRCLSKDRSPLSRHRHSQILTC